MLSVEWLSEAASDWPSVRDVHQAGSAASGPGSLAHQAQQEHRDHRTRAWARAAKPNAPSTTAITASRQPKMPAHQAVRRPPGRSTAPQRHATPYTASIDGTVAAVNPASSVIVGAM